MTSAPGEARDQLEAGGTTYQTQADGSSAFQWLRMAITQASPAHVWHAGKGYDADAFDGFTAHTDGHVWVHAKGGSASPDGGGTLTIQSEGQSWLQSTAGPLSFVASGNVVFGSGTESKSGFKLGTQGGLTIVADRTVTASTVSATDPGATMSAEDQASTVATNWGIWWTSLDTACAIGLNVMDRVLAAALDGSAMPSGKMNWLMTSMGMCANFAGAGANLYGMIGGAAGADTPSGMTLAGEAGVLIGAEQGVNIWGAPGALLGSAFATVFAGLATGSIAGVDWGMSSLGTVDMSSLVASTMTALASPSSVGVELAARKGKFESEAKTNLSAQSGKGTIEARATATMSVESTQWVDLVSAKGAVGLKSNGTLAVETLTKHSMGLMAPGTQPGNAMPDMVSAAAPADVPIVKAPIPGPTQGQIMMSAAGGVKILSGPPASAPLVKITADKVEMKVGSAGPTATVDASQAELKLQGSSVKLSATSLKIDGTEVSFS